MKKKLLLNTGTSLLLQIVTVVSGFILPRLILERYGSEVNGLTQSIKQFLSIISFLELGVGQVIQSNLYRPLAEKDSSFISKVLKSGETFFRKIAIALIVYIFALMILFPYLTDQRFHWMYTATLICAIGIGNFAQYYLGIVDKLLLNADQKGYIQYGSQIGAVVLNTVVSIFLIRKGFSIQFVKLSTSVVFLIRPLIVRQYVNHNYEIDRKIRCDVEPIRQKWNGIAQHISAVVLENTDTIVLTTLSSLSDVSIYSVYFLVVSGIKQFYEAATVGIQSAVGRLLVQKETIEIKVVFTGIETILHCAVVFLFSCIGMLIVPFAEVYTNGLTDANYIQPIFAAILTLAYGVRCLRTPYNIFILASGHYKQTQCCHIITAFLNLIVSVVSVARWGLVGVAIGTLVAMIYQTFWMTFYTIKNLVKCSVWHTIKQYLSDIITVLLIYTATSGVKLQEVSYIAWFGMAIRVAVIALVCTVIMAVLFSNTDFMRFYKIKAR